MLDAETTWIERGEKVIMITGDICTIFFLFPVKNTHSTALLVYLYDEYTWVNNTVLIHTYSVLWCRSHVKAGISVGPATAHKGPPAPRTAPPELTPHYARLARDNEKIHLHQIRPRQPRHKGRREASPGYSNNTAQREKDTEPNCRLLFPQTRPTTAGTAPSLANKQSHLNDGPGFRPFWGFILLTFFSV